MARPCAFDSATIAAKTQQLGVEEGGGIEPLWLVTIPPVSGRVASHLAAPSRIGRGGVSRTPDLMVPGHAPWPLGYAPTSFWWTGGVAHGSGDAAAGGNMEPGVGIEPTT